MPVHRRTRLYFALLSAAAGPAALAQPVPDDVADRALALDRVVVVGSRTPKAISEIPGTVWVIEREQLQQQARAGVPLKEALGALVPGLDIGPQGRTNYGQNLRGRGVLVMIDGVSLNSTRGISRQFDSIDPFNIERIEVLSGANAVYGGGATGGIVNIITKRGTAGPAALETELGVRSGFRNGADRDLRLAQSISGGSETVAGRLAVAAQDNGAAYGGNGRQVLVDITQTDLQYNRSLDLTGGLDVAFGGGRSLQLSGQLYDSGYRGDSGLYLGPNLSGVLGRVPRTDLIEVQEGFVSDVEPQTRRSQFNGQFHATDVLGGQDLYLQGFARTEKLDFHPFPGSVAVPNGRALQTYSSSRQNTDFAGAKLLLLKQWDRVGLSYGVDMDNETFEATQVIFDPLTAYGNGGLVFNRVGSTGRYPGYEIDGVSAFVQGDWRATDVLTLNAGWRRQRMDVSVDDFVASNQQLLVQNGIGTAADAIPGGSNDYSVNLFNAGAVLKLSPRQQAWLSYSEGFELPDPGKYYGVGSYRLEGGRWRLLDSVNIAQSPMSGIKTRQIETGWRVHDGGLDAQAAVFYAWSDRTIVRTSTFNIDEVEQDARNYGFEGQLTYRFDSGWQLGGNGLWVRAQEKVDGDWQRQSVTLASPPKSVLWTGWSDERWNVRLQSTRSFDLDDAAGVEIDGYTTVDLLGSARLPLGTLSAGIQNIADRDYTTVWGQRAQALYGSLAAAAAFDYRGRGRTFALTYSIDY